MYLSSKVFKKIYIRKAGGLTMYNQYILFGAPGTGKSHLVSERIKQYQSDKVFRVTFHQEYLYTDFIGQLLPQKKGDNIKFEFVPGPFTEALKEAYMETDKEVFLVLEEISRGNVAAIFGDVFQLLDRDEHFVSKFPIRNHDIASQIKQLHDDIIELPANFNIICTVNLNDQNVFPMDTAFKRRFDWEYVSTSPVLDKKGNVDTKLNNPKILLYSEGGENITINWLSFYTSLNQFILDPVRGLGKKEDKQIGQFFINFEKNLVSDSNSPDISKSKEALVKVDTLIKNKLLMYLWQDIQSNSSFSAIKLFNDTISSFDELYRKFGKENVFSEQFISVFLMPNISKFDY